MPPDQSAHWAEPTTAEVIDNLDHIEELFSIEFPPKVSDENVATAGRICRETKAIIERTREIVNGASNTKTELKQTRATVALSKMQDMKKEMDRRMSEYTGL